MTAYGRVYALLGLGLVLGGGLPQCSCDEPESLIRAESEMLLTFLEEDSCSPNVIQRRIPDDYAGGLIPSTDFGSRGERRFEIRSVGLGALTVNKVSLSEGDPEFSLEVTDANGDQLMFPVSLPPNSGSTPGVIVAVRYSATDAAPDRVDLVVETDDEDRSEVRFGLVAGRGQIEVCAGDQCGTEASVEFDSVPVGGSSLREVTIRNVGDGALDLRAIRLASPSVEFCAPEATELPDGTFDCNLVPQCLVLLPGESYTVSISYRPFDGSRDDGELVIVSGDASAGNVTVPIGGRGAGPAICVCIPDGDECVRAGLVDFGLVDVGASAERDVRLLSCGTDPVDLTEAVLEMTAGSSFETDPEFSIVSPFTLGRVEAGQYAEGRLSYSPGAPGRHRGGLRYAFSQSRSNNWVALVGAASTCDLEVIPARVNFGTVAGGQQAQRSVALVNNGARDCTVDAITDPSPPFAHANKPNLPLVLASGQSFELTVRFSPPAGPVQSFAGSFEVVSDEPGAGAVNTVALVADGGGSPVCEVEVAPTSALPIPRRDGILNFGAVSVGYTTTLPIRITNNGNSDCSLTRARVASLFGGRDITLTTAQPLPLTIAPGRRVEIDVSYAPTMVSDIPYNPLTEAVDFSLAGPGLTKTDWSIGILARSTLPTIDVIPRDIDFGVVTWERPQAPDSRSSCGSERRVVSVYNSGTGPLRVTAIDIDPSSDAVFQVSAVRQAGALISRPYSNIPIAGGGSIEVELRFFPTRANPAGHRGLLVIDNDVTNPMGNGAPLTVPLTGEGTTNSQQTDRYTQLAANKVDILWVIDDSGSMQEEQTLLSQNFGAFIGFADTLGVDYQVGVTTTEVQDSTVAGIMWACRGFSPIIRSSDSNRVAAFACAAQVTNPPGGNSRPNPGGSDDQEAGLQAARMALDVPNVNGANSGFLRSDARIAVIIVSDEDDQSSGSVNLYTDFFRNLKGFRNSQLVSVSAIAGDVPNGCSTAVAGTRYDAAVSALTGQFESICSSSWDRMLRSIGLGVFALRSSWTLSRPADPTTIRVTVDGQVVVQGSANGWTFDQASNSVTFSGTAVPSAGAQVEVSYGARCLP